MPRVANVTTAAILLSIILTGPPIDQLAAAESVPTLNLPGEHPAKVQSSPACPNNICPGLGNAFYLPDGNALAVRTGGSVFFKERGLGDCALVSEAKENNNTFKAANSWDEFVSQVMTEANLSGSYQTSALTVKGTAKSMTGYELKTEKSLHSTHMDISVVTSAVDFQQNSRCFGAQNLDPQFVRNFESLPKINRSIAHEAAQWNSYVEFLSSIGSHIMMQQLIGSRFQQWESTDSSSSDIAKKLEIKACAEVEGTKQDGGWSVNVCGAYNSQEKQESLRTSSQTQRLILGSTDEARGALTKAVTKETLEGFIDGAEKGTGAVRFVFKPIWQLLIQIYQPLCGKDGKGSAACDNLQRAVNLQAAFEGWTAIGCTLQIDGQNMSYQAFEVDSSNSLGIETYRCRLAKTGCRTDDDCHLGGAIGTVCYCYGSNCVDQGESFASTFRNKIWGDKSGGSADGVNNSCYYKFGAYCDCDKSWAGGLPNRTIYLQSAPNL